MIMTDAALGKKLRELVNDGTIDVHHVIALFPNLRASTSPAIKISEEAIRLAREFVAEPNKIVELKRLFTDVCGPAFPDLVENIVIVSRELLRVAGESE